jgi:hypothetical protein
MARLHFQPISVLTQEQRKHLRVLAALRVSMCVRLYVLGRSRKDLARTKAKNVLEL